MAVLSRSRQAKKGQKGHSFASEIRLQTSKFVPQMTEKTLQIRRFLMKQGGMTLRPSPVVHVKTSCRMGINSLAFASRFTGCIRKNRAYRYRGSSRK
jgi:hypothetical protein